MHGEADPSPSPAFTYAEKRKISAITAIFLFVSFHFKDKDTVSLCTTGAPFYMSDSAEHMLLQQLTLFFTVSVERLPVKAGGVQRESSRFTALFSNHASNMRRLK